jgi:putative membrane protein
MDTAAAILPYCGVPPDPAEIWSRWRLDPVVLAVLGALWLCYVIGCLRAQRSRAGRVPRRGQRWCFHAGALVATLALVSPLCPLSVSLFAARATQHVLLTLVAAPLIALGAPITTLLRAATPDVRHRVILPILHSRVMKVLSFPVVSWVVFAVVMWGSHFSPLFNASLEDPLIHDLEHTLYLGAGLLFWWPVVAADPSPWRMPHAVRAMYVFLQMPQNTFLAVVILNSAVPLYAHYATLVRSWGPTALEDQQVAGGLMWITGDVLFLAAIAALLIGWMRKEQADEAAADRRVDAARAAIRDRESNLADRLAGERDGR